MTSSTSNISLNSVKEQLEQIRLNANDDKKCTICSLVIIDDDIKLDCGHEYHYQCILNWFKKNVSTFRTTSKSRECPYCRTPSGYLPFRDTYIKNIHHPEYQPKLIVTSCQGKTKRGHPCKLRGINGYCYLHNPNSSQDLLH